MNDRLETIKYTFTVEGETEQLYLYWLRDQINQSSKRKYNVAVDVRVQQHPRKFYKAANSKSTPLVYHICDVESQEDYHVEKFHDILSEMRDAKDQKGINYKLGYSNFSFELWMILHKEDCNGSFAHRRQYIKGIIHAYNEHFADLDEYKHEANFKRCLSKLSLDDVIIAITRATTIAESNKVNHRKKVSYRGFSYYVDNPALSIHEVVRNMLKECGIISK